MSATQTTQKHLFTRTHALILAGFFALQAIVGAYLIATDAQAARDAESWWIALKVLGYLGMGALPAFLLATNRSGGKVLAVGRLLAEWIFLMPDAERKNALNFHWLYLLDLILISIFGVILFYFGWKAAFGEWAKGRAYWPTVWRQFKKSWLSLGALGIVFFLVVVALLADFLASDKPIIMSRAGKLYILPNFFNYPELLREDIFTLRKDTEVAWKIEPPIPYGPLQDRVDGKLAVAVPPGARHFLVKDEQGNERREGPIHLMGTDDRGRDVFSRTLHGARISLSVGFVAVGIYVLIGLFLGSAAGYFGGWVDWIVSRLTEILLSFPSLILILAMMAVIPNAGIFTVMVAIGVTRWTGVSRLVRAEILKLKAMDFISAARALGVPPWQIITRHLLPNSMGPVLVSATFGVAAAIIIEASLSFLGFGVQPPTPSWGELLLQSRQNLSNWWLVLFPTLAIFLSVTVYNLVGEGLRDAIDPKMKRD